MEEEFREEIKGGEGLKAERLDEMLEKSFWRDILYEIISTMEPWDIDISELAARYSMKVDAMKEMNFRIPANVLIVSAVLLRMKSQFIAYSGKGFDLSADEFMEDSELAGDDASFLLGGDAPCSGGNGGNGGNGADVSEYLQVRPKRVPKRRITALELLSAIQEVLEDKVLKSRIKEAYVEENLIINLSTDIKHIIEETYQKVMDILSRTQKDVVLFSELAHGKDEVVYTFISLLHLSNRQRVKLAQEKMFDEIYIRV